MMEQSLCAIGRCGVRCEDVAARIMYVKPNCPYCDEARVSLRADGVDFEERDATTRADWRAELMAATRDTGKVPTIVMGDEVVTIGWKGRG
jgi:glutaredoxin